LNINIGAFLGDGELAGRKIPLTNSEKILLLLSDFHRFEKEYRVPGEVSQRGIANIIGIRRSNVARELMKLKQRSFVHERLVHFENTKRRKKGYFLTSEGFGLAAKIRDFVNEKTIIFRNENGMDSSIKVSEIRNVLGKDIRLAEVVTRISKDGVFDASGPIGGIEENVDAKLAYPRFVGRDTELNRILEAFDDVIRSMGKCLLVSGEAGIGKTRLVTEIIERLRKKDIHVLHGSCLYQTSIDPYMPFVEALGDYLARAEDGFASSAAKDIRSTAPEFADLILSASGEDGMDIKPEGRDINLIGERTRIFETFSKVLLRIADEKPVVLFIDDLHWADMGSVHLLHYLARKIKEKPVMIISAYRPEELTSVDGKIHPFKVTLSRLKSENIAEEIVLKRLNPSESRRMVELYLEIDEIPEAFANLIHGETEGNPFFIEEILSTIEEGQLDQLPSKIDIPKSIKETIVRRIGMLERNARVVLDVASVIGDKFEIDILLSAMDDEGTVLDSLDILSDARLIEEAQSGQFEGYRFHHCKIREVAYEMLNLPRRRILHNKVAMILEETYRDNINDIIGELAHHYFNTREYEKAFEYSRKAAEKASVVYSYDEAVKLYQVSLNALQNLEKSPNLDHKWIGMKKAVVYHKLGDAYDILGKWNKALDSYKSGLNLETDGDGKAKLIAKIGNTYRKKGLHDDAIDFCNAALNSLNRNRPERRIILNCLGSIYASRGEFERASDYLSESLKIAEDVGDENTVSSIYNKMGVICTSKHELEKALDFYNKCLEIRRRIGNERDLAGIYNNLGALFVDSGEYDSSLEHFGKCLEIMERVGDYYGIALTHNNLGVLYLHYEEYGKALDSLEKSLQMADSIGDIFGVVKAWYALGEVRFEKGELDTSERCFQTGLDLSGKMGKNVIRAYCVHGLARCALKKNDDYEGAMELCDRALADAREIGLKGLEGLCLSLKGTIQAESGKWDLAVESFEESIEIAKKGRMRKQLGETYLEYGRMTAKRGETEKAKSLMELARKAFEECGLLKKVEEVDFELKNV
jgi:tetratricopeptide (TPR) repeat protein/DNA-binding MarR family transcriptional regulator